MDLMTRRRAIMSGKRWSRLPEEYQEVEYIEGVSTTYIQTKIIPPINMIAKATYMDVATGTGNGGGIVYAMGASDKLDWRFYRYNNKLYFDIPGPSGDYGPRIVCGNNSFVANKKYQYEFGNFYIKNLETETTIATGTKQNTNGTGYIQLLRSAYARFYYLCLLDSSNKIAEFIPCYRKADSKPGMYDLISKTFFTNAGTDEFLVGPAVN